MNIINTLCWIAMMVLATVPLVAGEHVSHQQLGFQLSVPDGFVSDPERVQGKVIYAFQRPPAGDQETGVFLLISQLGGVLGREKINPKELAAKNPQVTIASERWKGFDIRVFRVPEQLGEVQFVTFNAQVPLKPRAIQVTVIGERAREDELRGALRSVLANLDGQTYWLNTEQRVQRLAKGVTQLTVTLGGLVVIAIVLWRALRQRNAIPERP